MPFQIADLFEIVADAIPDRLALVAGDERLSFAELDARSNRLAHVLTSLGVGEGDHVGLQLLNGTAYIEGMLAAYKLRAVPINVNYRYVADELEYLYDNADLRLLLYHRRFADAVAQARRRFGRPSSALVVEDGSTGSRGGDRDYSEALEGASAARDFAPRSPRDLYILYTGGTTGMPKGVMWHHEDILFGAILPLSYKEVPERPEELAERVRERPPHSSLVIAPLMHGAAQWATLSAWFAGRCAVLWTESGLDPEAIWRLAAGEAVSGMQVVGDAMARPLAEALARSPGAFDLRSLRMIGSGGAILSDGVKETLRSVLPELVIADSFGSSESGSQGNLVGRGGEGSPRFAMNDTTCVLDESLRPIAPGSGRRGRLARTGRIPFGYYKDAKKTAETFPVDAEGRRWVVPGDCATVESDGTITIFGRGSVSINTGGEKVFPEEVELAVRSHPDVFDAVVVGVPDERFGERVAAVVQPRPGARPTLEQLAAHARTKVAGYKVPREIHLVDGVVRSPSGKPDYRWARSVARGET